MIAEVVQLAITEPLSPSVLCSQGGSKHLKLGGHDALRALFLKKKGAFSKNKMAMLCLLQHLLGQVPPVAPGSYVCVCRRTAFRILKKVGVKFNDLFH